ncbi:MAG: hypothetical protein ACFE0Q_13660 [Anaerolineae bacterium]
MQTTHHQTNQKLLTTFIGTILGILVFLAVLGGLPAPEQISVFVLGLVVLIVITLGFAVAGWHLLARPLPEGLRQQGRLHITPTEYQGLAIAMFASHILLTVGGVWDEIWHVRYGLALGEDFFWRPHIMMYIGFIGVFLLGIYAWHSILTQGTGTLQQRFRANKLLGVLALMGAFMAYALPADPIWHMIYGEDLTAWSLPHVLLILIWVMVSIIAIGLQMAVASKREWASILKLNANDLIPLLVVSFINLMVLVMLATEWEYFNITGTLALDGLDYPDWLFPLFIAFTATFSGVLINLSTRRYGSATLVGLLTVGIRLGLVYALDHVVHSANPWLLTLGPLIALDVLFALYARRSAPPVWIIAIGASLGMMLITLPVLSQLYAVPEIRSDNLIPIALAVTIGAMLATWLVHTITTFLVDHTRSQPATSNRTRLMWMAPLAFSVLAIFIIWLIITAQPPVLS